MALAVAGWRHDAAFDPTERLVLEYAEAMTGTPPVVSDELFARLRAALAPQAIVELTAVIGFQNLSARFNAALQAQAHGFCALPAADGDREKMIESPAGARLPCLSSDRSD